MINHNAQKLSDFWKYTTWFLIDKYIFFLVFHENHHNLQTGRALYKALLSLGTQFSKMLLVTCGLKTTHMWRR